MLDNYIYLTAYTACALVVWIAAYVIARRRGPDGWRLALIAIPLSLLGPLAIVPGAILRKRSVRPPRPATPAKPKPPPTGSPEPTPKAPQPPPTPPLEPTPKAAQPMVQARRRRPSKHPKQMLAALLIGSLLAFPVAAIAIFILLALGGAKLITAHDAHVIAVISGLAAGVVLVVTARFWSEQRHDISKTTSYMGWLLILIAAGPIIAATVVSRNVSAPTNLGRPSISGRAEVGSLLIGDAGRWSDGGRPPDFDYQWQDCGRTCVDIYRATESTYLLTQRDLHKRILLSVSATPTRGWFEFSSDWTDSKETPPVIP